MNLQAEQIRLISQVLTIQDAALLLRARQFLNNLLEQSQDAPLPLRLTEAELLAKIDASESAFEQDDVLSHEEAVAHFQNRAKQS